MLPERFLDARSSFEILHASLVDLPPPFRKFQHPFEHVWSDDNHPVEIGEDHVSRVDGRRGEVVVFAGWVGGHGLEWDWDLNAGRTGEGRLAEDRLSAGIDLRESRKALQLGDPNGEVLEESLKSRRNKGSAGLTGNSRARSSARSRHRPEVTKPFTPLTASAVARSPPSEAFLASVRRGV